MDKRRPTAATVPVSERAYCIDLVYYDETFTGYAATYRTQDGKEHVVHGVHTFHNPAPKYGDMRFFAAAQQKE
jgi:hypothetical protein